MKLVCVGLNWRTPIHVREKIAFDVDNRAQGLKRLQSLNKDGEYAILSTCNRTEVIASARPNVSALTHDDLAHFLSDFRDLSLDEFYPHLYRLEGMPVAEHLFQVTAGLDSLILGEAQILAQVKQCYQAAIDVGTAGPVLHAVFQKALNVAKRVHTETGLARGRLSIASAAVDYVKGVFEVFRDKTILLIGAGKMAELTAKHLQSLEPRRVIVTNRRPERGEELASRLKADFLPYSRLFDALTQADIVISSTGATEPIVSASDFVPIMKARRQRLIAIIDIALPRDFDADIGDMDNVLLWNIDDLEKVRHQTIRNRRHELARATKIVEDELQKFAESITALKTGPLISMLDREYQRIIDDELDWLIPQLNGISEGDREKIRHFASRIKNKLLHAPKSALKDHTHESHRGFVETLQRMLGLNRSDEEQQ